MLATRFGLTDQQQDMGRAILLCGEILREWYDALTDSEGQQQNVRLCQVSF
jgi:hypothetical protein